MKKFQKARLLKLADLLEADAKNKKGIKFDLGVVGESSFGFTDNYVPGVNCGTAACAMGLAAISGTFKRGGLSYKFTKSLGQIRCTINGRTRDYDNAAKAVFGITDAEASFLFSPLDYDDTPRGAEGERFVAKRIRAFVKDRSIVGR